MRTSANQIERSRQITRLLDGFDYDKQAWVVNGQYIRCGHPEDMNCQCYGRIHEGEKTEAENG